MGLAALVAVAAIGCDGDDETPADADATTTAADAGDTSVATTTDASDTAVGDVADATDDTSEDDALAVGPTACCLSMSDGLVVWAEDGDIWLYDAESETRERIVGTEATQKDPALDGRRLVWADDRGGDFDIWTMDLDEGVASALVTAPGDQDQPSISGERVVFVGRTRAPHDATVAEIYVVDVADPTTPRALTDDYKEQAHPHIHGDKVVWSDFRNSETGIYVDLASPIANNSDIYGWDLESDEELVISTDGSKQLRPAVWSGDDGDIVAWLDWRGINPEPKYSEFQVFAARRGQPERLVAWSTWSRPALWQRPAIANGVVAWIAETEGGDDVRTAVWAAGVDGGTPYLVHEARGILDAVAIDRERAAWVGGGKLGVKRLTPAR